MNLEANTQKIFTRIQQAKDSVSRTDAVNVIAVTKYVDSNTTSQLIDTGIKHIGENRVDKFLTKYRELQDKKVYWHFIGSLQRRKVKDIINYVDYFHALDSVKLAHEISKRANHTINCFIQVNISGEASKYGFSSQELELVLDELSQLPNLKFVGLMTMAPAGASQEDLKAIFEKTYQLKETIKAKQLSNMPMSELSMGMSGDFQSAIEHGATFVRIGTAFFQ